MERRRNFFPLAGFLVCVVAFLSYFVVFYRFPATRDVPWVNWLLFALGLVLVAGLAAVAVTFRHYGSNWDEAVQAHYGQLAVDYFRSGFVDRRVNRFLNLRFYGPLVEMIPAALSGGAAAPYELRHLILPLFGLATLPAVFAYAARAGTGGLPFLAALGAATMPRFYGDWFANSKDVPFACLFAWSMAALAALFTARRAGPGRVAACGVAFGLAAAVRPGGLPILGACFVAAAALSLALGGRERGPVADRVPSLLLQGVGVLAIAWAVMVLPWPWAHANPIVNPIAAMREAAAFTTTYPVLFGGVFYESNAVPRPYLLTYLLITTPPALIGLAVVGVGAGLVEVRRAPDRSFPFLLTLVWLALPLGLFALLRPNVYDGLRHFLFVLPAIAILAAGGAHWLVHRFTAARGRGAALAACAVLFLLPVKDLVALHPYQTTYFNGLVGGVGGAAGRYDTEYWLTSYREAIAWVNAQAARRPGPAVGVDVAGDGYIAPWVEHYAGPRVRARVVSAAPETPVLPAGVDYYVATTRWGFDRGYRNAPIVHTIGRAGAVFTVVKGRGPDG